MHHLPEPDEAAIKSCETYEKILKMQIIFSPHQKFKFNSLSYCSSSGDQFQGGTRNVKRGREDVDSFSTFFPIFTV